MIINESVALSTSKLLLVPYSTHHVEQYHLWMQNPDLQTATASEPLSIDEEYAMQRSWRTDQDKLTFIICRPLSQDSGLESVEPGGQDLAEQMVGDINLFLFMADTEDDDETDDKHASLTALVIGEIELMIARKDLQGHGYGRAALLTFLDYIISNWQQIAEEFASDAQQSSTIPSLKYLRVKINQNNQRSISLFESVGFKLVGEGPNYFGEVELRWQPGITRLVELPWYEQPQQLRYLLPS